MSSNSWAPALWQAVRESFSGVNCPPLDRSKDPPEERQTSEADELEQAIKASLEDTAITEAKMTELKAEVLKKKAKRSWNSGTQRSPDRIAISSSSDEEEQDFHWVENVKASKGGVQSEVSKGGNSRAAPLAAGKKNEVKVSKGGNSGAAPLAAGKKNEVRVSKGSNSGAALKSSDGAAPGAAHLNASSRKPVNTWQLPSHSGAAKFGPCVLGGFCSDHCGSRKQEEKEGQAEQSDSREEPNITSYGSNSRAAPEFATTGAAKTNQAEEGRVKPKDEAEQDSMNTEESEEWERWQEHGRRVAAGEIAAPVPASRQQFVYEAGPIYREYLLQRIKEVTGANECDAVLTLEEVLQYDRPRSATTIIEDACEEFFKQQSRQQFVYEAGPVYRDYILERIKELTGANECDAVLTLEEVLQYDRPCSATTIIEDACEESWKRQRDYESGRRAKAAGRDDEEGKDAIDAVGIEGATTKGKYKNKPVRASLGGGGANHEGGVAERSKQEWKTKPAKYMTGLVQGQWWKEKANLSVVRRKQIVAAAEPTENTAAKQSKRGSKLKPTTQRTSPARRKSTRTRAKSANANQEQTLAAAGPTPKTAAKQSRQQDVLKPTTSRTLPARKVSKGTRARFASVRPTAVATESAEKTAVEWSRQERASDAAR
jgi:hypothetical protein